MKLSISNLAWQGVELAEVAPSFVAAGLDGVEIAPTTIWPDAPDVAPALARQCAEQWAEQGVAVSGIQSLLFGHPEHQLFDRATWPDMVDHLRSMIALAGHLRADVAVFGSPRNRIKGDLESGYASELAVEFFRLLTPTLEQYGVVLTLEPNAPAYGADFLTHYAEAVSLADTIASPWVQPQIDTGCLSMVGDDLAAAVDRRVPGHVHASAPNLGPPPAELDHASLARELAHHAYDGWVVLEMLPAGPDPVAAAVSAARWLVHAYPQSSP